MKLITASKAATLLASTAILASPIHQRRELTSVDFLEYALALEHLENAFYKGGVSTMSEQTFIDAGFTSAYYTNLLYITRDEEQHVNLLTETITAAGKTPIAPCTYDFPYKDPRSFAALASILEGVGVSAYLGSDGLITDNEDRGIATSILVTESVHNALHRFNLGEIASPDPYGTPIDISATYTLAAPFIKSCPDEDNPVESFVAFPTLTPTQGLPTAPGISFTFKVDGMLPGEYYVTFVSGLDTISVDPIIDDEMEEDELEDEMSAEMEGGMIKAIIPETAMGQTYVFITSQPVDGTVTDDLVLFGPAVLEVTPPSPMFDVAQQ